MTINDRDESKTPTKPVEVKTPEEQLSPPIEGELETTAISDILGLAKEESGKYHDKLDILLEWAKTKTDDHSIENLKWTIRDLGFKLGTPPLGQKLVNWLAEYAFLELESQKVNKRLEEFKHGG